MKKVLFLLIIGITLTYCSSSRFLNQLKKDAQKTLDSKSIGSGYTAEEAAKALKEALVQGTTKGTNLISKVDGFYKNPEIKIPFPPEAKKVEETLKDIGLENQVDEVVLSLNRAAEDASKSAKNIFVDAITDMTINDAINIVKGDNHAATTYLKNKTTIKLTNAFSPVIKNSLDKVNATKYWSTAMNTYNKVPFVEKVNPDLTQYVTGKALDALFLMISREEELIRKDPIARTTELLKKVFGS
jgi:sRNA-binding protein